MVGETVTLGVSVGITGEVEKEGWLDSAGVLGLFSNFDNSSRFGKLYSFSEGKEAYVPTYGTVESFI